MAAAVHPKPIKRENTARPLKPTRESTPSEKNARRERSPLSSSSVSERKSMPICGKKHSTPPRLLISPSPTKERKTGEGIFSARA